MTGAKKPDPVTPIIEIIDVIDWRFVILAGIAGAVVVFVALAMIEHTDNAPASPLSIIDLPGDE